jgi:hypothetical protein
MGETVAFWPPTNAVGCDVSVCIPLRRIQHGEVSTCMTAALGDFKQKRVKRMEIFVSLHNARALGRSLGLIQKKAGVDRVDVRPTIAAAMSDSSLHVREISPRPTNRLVELHDCDFMEPGNRHLIRGKTIGPNSEERECGLAPIDR